MFITHNLKKLKKLKSLVLRDKNGMQQESD